MKTVRLFPVINGGPWSQWNTVRNVLRRHKNLAWNLMNDFRRYAKYLDGTEKPDKKTVTRYENEITQAKHKIKRSSRAIQTMKRYGLLSMYRGLQLPIVPYILKAVEESGDPTEGEIDLVVQHGLAGFIAVNSSCTKHYPRDLHTMMDFIHIYGKTQEYNNQTAAPYMARVIINCYLALLRSLMHNIFMNDEAEDQGQPIQEALRVVK